MDKRLDNNQTYKGYTLVNEFGVEKYLFFRPTDEDSEVEASLNFWKSKGWTVKDVYKGDDLSEFLSYWFRFIRDLATDSDNNFCCGRVKYWGCVCRELIDLMKDEDIYWGDIGIEGELFIHLSIVADNHKYCVLMED